MLCSHVPNISTFYFLCFFPSWYFTYFSCKELHLWIICFTILEFCWGRISYAVFGVCRIIPMLSSILVATLTLLMEYYSVTQDLKGLNVLLWQRAMLIVNLSKLILPLLFSLISFNFLDIGWALISLSQLLPT